MRQKRTSFTPDFIGLWILDEMRSSAFLLHCSPTPKLNGPKGLACMVAGSLEEDYRPPPRATGHERALCICGFRGRVFLNNAQLYLPDCNHVAEQFEPFGTFEDIGYHHRLDLDSRSAGLSPQPRTGM